MPVLALLIRCNPRPSVSLFRKDRVSEPTAALISGQYRGC